MSTVYGVNKTLARNPIGSNIMRPGLQKGKVIAILDNYEADAVDIADIIEMGVKIPKGATVIEVALRTDALGSSVTLTVGDYEDPDRYITATECNTANQVLRTNAITGAQYHVDETTEGDTTTDRQIIVTVGGAAATGTIYVEVTYVYAQ